MTNTCPQLPPGMADASWQKHFELLWGSDYIILRINKSFEPSRSGLSWQIPKPPWSWVNLGGGWQIFNQALNQLFYRDKSVYMSICIDWQQLVDRNSVAFWRRTNTYALSQPALLRKVFLKVSGACKTVTSRCLHAWILPPLVQFEEEED